ncbi:neurogenic locus notch homolog protein 1 isoform X2 [Lingula anatina]|uniref:Neurogenic locus notch homolog protein 1 isoform X2 n=1 Tax=Lingula anatina TaxID=7574 RepID=A0A2R2MJU4_LINAN|nr:neurogenic locus notch homolog protein 1 isoform X2 [Lingula anatina]|eukprot:XP_023930468.1 neurogenic locus notch homolog protein 1 isoform X2 [Lingula anatina]
MITSYFYHGITMSGLTVYLLTALFLGMLHTCTGQGAISFIGTPYFARVYPGAPAGTHVITVTAVPSSGITTGQPIRYYISNNANKYFSIDHTSGKIEVKKSYSTSKGQQFIFDVIARQGSKIGQTRVSVEISEENKYPPVFSRPSYNTVVWRRSSVGTTILIVSTSDNDTAPYNRLVRYSVNATSSDSSYFSIDPRSGKVNLRQQLPQAQSVTQIEASIVATDPGVPEMTASVTLSVNISLISEPTQLETKFSNETTVLLCWREPAHGSQIKGYLVEYWPIDSYDARRSETVRADKFSSLYCTTVGNLTSWDVYHFQVSAYNDDGYGVPSVIPNVPTVPRGVCGLKPCRNEGTCVPIRQRPGFKCQCKEGYYGRICERKTACASQPCLNNGQCVPLNLRGPTLGASITAAFILSYRCRCPPGTSGKNCEHVDACFSNPCQNLGSCINLKSNNSYACRCLPMNYGTNCELSNHCHSSPCKNSGTCRNLSNSPKPDGYSCDCLPGYSGSECELFDPCFSSPCLHKGSCTPLGDRFSCTCPPGYYNDTCELINACELHTPCKNNATCVHTDTVGDYMCTCAPGWTGFNCTDYNACLLSPCANNATCVQTDGGASFQCNCLTGYYGDTCQSFNPCVSSPCFGNATCLNTTSDTFQCQCPDGYYGKICDQTYNKCVGNTCENMNCTIDSGRTEVCSCTENYFGNNCQYFDYCSKNPCENNGTCQTENATYKCTCIDGYYGNHCQFRNPCVIRGCLNGGKCENVSLTDFICHCRDGYSGENCETYDPCASSPCQNGALCNRSSDTNFTCICGTGFYGELCDLFDPCSSNPCSVMSTCNATSNENFTCECSHGYYGERCDFFDICSIDGLCENGGTCRNASINNTYTCDCPAGFWGEACEMIDPCFTADCKNNATCRAINETNFECACAAGYTGERCETFDICSNALSVVCFNGGVCTARANSTFECKCGAGFSGNRCQNYNFCSSSVCQNGGSCVLYNVTATLPLNASLQSVIDYDDEEAFIVNSYKCACIDPYTGPNCETNLGHCFSHPCKYNSTCMNLPGGYKCFCLPGYSGINCEDELNKCFSSPCKNGATCVDLVDSYSCICPSHLTGTHCEHMIISANLTEIEPNDNATIINPCDSNPCLNNGACVPGNQNHTYTCTCPLHFTGRACEEMAKPNNASTNVTECEPCKNNASCLMTADGGINCVCSANFTGENCETKIPEVVDPCDDLPCLNNGTCTAKDTELYTCECLELYTGENCELKFVEDEFTNQTQNVSSTLCASNPCKNSGSCQEGDSSYVCVCMPPFIGTDCENTTFTANGTANTRNATKTCDSNPCKNNATCVQENGSFTCECSKNYVGVLCETFVVGDDTNRTQTNVSGLCDTNPCMNNGSCLEREGEIICVCTSGFRGKTCDTPLSNNNATDPNSALQCETNPCWNGGTCFQLNQNFRCDCADGFAGKFCDIRMPTQNETKSSCYPSPCHNNGTCVETGITFRCHCPRGFAGRHCELANANGSAACDSLPCMNNGTCTTTDSGFQCLCQEGFTGERCEGENVTTPCYSGYCLNGGTCSNNGTDAQCECFSNYTGPRCELSRVNACASNPCHRAATCLEDGAMGYTCICAPGKTGRNCHRNIDSCSSSPCKHAGTCVIDPSNETFSCICQRGYSGALCEDRLNDTHDACAEHTCFNNGTCTVLPNGPVCHCLPDFTGEDCQMLTNPCASSPCVGNSVCEIVEDSYRCLCTDDSTDPLCRENENPCSSSPCLHGATCSVHNNNTFKCICAEGFQGLHCDTETDPCSPSPCVNNASCVRVDNMTTAFNCQCQPGYGGDLCQDELDECLSNPCVNNATCVDEVGGYGCQCPPGYTGANCEIDLDECRSDPCQNGGSCDDGPSGYTCSCQPGYSGVHCQIAATCQNETLINSKGKFVWPKSRHSQGVVSIECPYGSPGNGQATRRCSVDSSGMARWETPQLEQCNELGPSGAREVATKTVNATSVPENLAPEKVSSVADEMQIVVDYATVDMEIAKNMLTTISNVMDADEEVLHESNDQSHAAERLLQVLEHFTESVNLTSVSKIQLESSNIAVEAMEVPLPNRRGPENSEEKNTTHGGVKTQWKNTRMFLPTEVFEQSASEAENVNATTTRVSFVYYANSKFFMEHNHSEEKYGSLENRGVVAATVKNTRILNLTEPVVFTLPNVEVGAPHICAFWNATARVWSTDGLEVNSTDENSTTCFSRHLTNFAILLDPTPSEAIPLQHQISLALISYIGCGLSLCGLVLTILTYGLFRCLHGDNSGKILINLCASMLLMNITFVAGTARSVSDAEVVCTVVAVLLHYFTLTTLMWMLVEAVHMYRLLVKIFRTYEPRFMLKRLLIAWGIPLIIVGVTVGINVDNYGGRDDLCRLTSANPYVYYISFLGPSCLILIFNSVVFVLVSRVILRPRVKGLQGKRSQEQPKVSAAQVRGAISVMVLLGITWVFGAFAAGEAKVVFAYIFCVANSLQGFLIFLFRCLLHPEARSAWVQLVTTGTFKKTRSRASSRASSGEHTNSHNSNHDNRRTFKETFTTNKIVKNTNVWHKARRFSSDSDEKNLKPLKYHDINLSYTFEDKFDNPLFKALNNSPSMAGPDDTKL